MSMEHRGTLPPRGKSETAGGDAGLDLSRMSVREAADAIARQVGAFKRAQGHVAGDPLAPQPRPPAAQPTEAVEPHLQSQPQQHPAPHPMLRVSANEAPRRERELDPPPRAKVPELVLREEDRITSSAEVLAAEAPADRPPAGRGMLRTLIVLALVAAGAWLAQRDAVRSGMADLSHRLTALWQEPDAPAASPTPQPAQISPPAAPAVTTEQAQAPAAPQDAAPRELAPPVPAAPQTAALPQSDSPPEQAALKPAMKPAADAPAKERATAATPPALPDDSDAPAQQAARQQPEDQTTLEPVARAGEALEEVPISTPRPAPLDLTTKAPVPRPRDAKPFIPTARPYAPAIAATPFTPVAKPFRPFTLPPQPAPQPYTP